MSIKPYWMEMVIPFRYDQAYSFSDGLAIVGKITGSEKDTAWTDEGDEYLATYYTLEKCKGVWKDQICVFSAADVLVFPADPFLRPVFAISP